MNIFKAIKTGNTASVVEFINNKGDIHVRDFYNMTPLIAAADEGRTDIVKLLIKYNADIEETVSYELFQVMLNWINTLEDNG